MCQSMCLLCLPVNRHGTMCSEMTWSTDAMVITTSNIIDRGEDYSGMLFGPNRTYFS